MKKKTKKDFPWKGWNKISPNKKQRIKMNSECGNKCFLGPELSFPICKKNTCKINKKGVWSAFIRARQWEKTKGEFGRLPYSKIAKKAKKLLTKKRKKQTGGNLLEKALRASEVFDLAEMAGNFAYKGKVTDNLHKSIQNLIQKCKFQNIKNSQNNDEREEQVHKWIKENPSLKIMEQPSVISFMSDYNSAEKMGIHNSVFKSATNWINIINLIHNIQIDDEESLSNQNQLNAIKDAINKKTIDSKKTDSKSKKLPSWNSGADENKKQGIIKSTLSNSNPKNAFDFFKKAINL